MVDKRYFQGLPSPAAAALIAGFIWLMTEFGFKGTDALWGVAIPWITFVLALYAGLTMVTNVPFYSFKDVQMKRSVPFVVIVLIVVIVVIVVISFHFFFY